MKCEIRDQYPQLPATTKKQKKNLNAVKTLNYSHI